jgi:hypothetical protein
MYEARCCSKGAGNEVKQGRVWRAKEATTRPSSAERIEILTKGWKKTRELSGSRFNLENEMERKLKVGVVVGAGLFLWQPVEWGQEPTRSAGSEAKSTGDVTRTD